MIHAPLSTMAEHITPTTGILEAAGPAQCRLTAGSDSLEALALHLAEMGHAFTILDPPELPAVARDLAARLTGAATPPRPAP